MRNEAKVDRQAGNGQAPAAVAAEKRLAAVVKNLREKMLAGFWGDVEIKFRDGVPVVINERRQVKLDDA